MQNALCLMHGAYCTMHLGEISKRGANGVGWHACRVKRHACG